MRQGRRYGLTTAQKADIWQRWRAGESLHEIGRAFGKDHGSIQFLLSQHGGIAPAVRRRSQRTLTLAEREEISRGIASGSSIREIARELQRAASTVSREVVRHGVRPLYRANEADQQAWSSALRPKTCLLAKRIAIWSRKQAARLVLQGNQTVLADIGGQSARFLELIESGTSIDDRKAFFAGLRSGRSEDDGQDRLSSAFHSYLTAFDSSDLQIKREAMITGNCEIVYHEHIRLEPYIQGAMPFIIRRCATERMMAYEIGEKVLKVGENVPGVHSPTAAKDWTKIEERMRYVFGLFRNLHGDPEVFSPPFRKL